MQTGILPIIPGTHMTWGANDGGEARVQNFYFRGGWSCIEIHELQFSEFDFQFSAVFLSLSIKDIIKKNLKKCKNLENF